MTTTDTVRASFSSLITVALVSCAHGAPTPVSPRQLDPDAQVVLQPTITWDDGQVTQQGTASLVDLGAPHGVAVVTSSHYLLGERTPTRLGLATVADNEVVVTSRRALGTPGSGIALAPGDLRSDYWFVLLDAAPPDTHVSRLSPKWPAPGTKVWFPNKSSEHERGYERIDGEVTKSNIGRIEVRLTRDIHLQSQSGSPVYEEASGNVIGLVVTGSNQEGSTTLALTPAAALDSWVTRFFPTVMGSDSSPELTSLVTMCDSGDGTACFQLGVQHNTGFGAPYDEEAAARYFETACDHQDGVACVALGYWATQESPPQHKAAEEYYRRACNLDPTGCLLLADQIRTRGNPSEADKHEVRTAYAKSCDANIPVACRLAAAGFIEKDRVRARELAQRGCELGDDKACLLESSLAQSGFGPKMAPGELLKRYERACDGGDPEACFEAGRLIAAEAQGKEELAPAMERWQKACDSGLVEGCALIGLMLMDGGDPNERDEGSKLVAKACADGSRYGCGHLASHYASKRDGERAFELYSQGCANKEALACLMTAGMMRASKGRLGSIERAEKLATDAVEFLDFECKANHAPACWALAKAFRKGFAVAKDAQKASAFGGLACKLEPNYCKRK